MVYNPSQKASDPTRKKPVKQSNSDLTGPNGLRESQMTKKELAERQLHQREMSAGSCPGSPKAQPGAHTRGRPLYQHPHSMSMPRRYNAQSTNAKGRSASTMSRSQEDRRKGSSGARPPWNGSSRSQYSVSRNSVGRTVTNAGGTYASPQMTTSNGMVFVGIGGAGSEGGNKCESLPASPRRYVAKYTTSATPVASKVAFHRPGSVTKVCWGLIIRP